MIKLAIILSLIATAQTSFSSVHCDEAVGKEALEAHKAKFEVCADTGCDISGVEYKGRVKARVKVGDETLLRTTKIKKYIVSIADEVETEKWSVQADSGDDCKILSKPTLQ